MLQLRAADETGSRGGDGDSFEEGELRRVVELCKGQAAAAAPRHAQLGPGCHRKPNRHRRQSLGAVAIGIAVGAAAATAAKARVCHGITVDRRCIAFGVGNCRRGIVQTLFRKHALCFCIVLINVFSIQRLFRGLVLLYLYARIRPARCSLVVINVEHTARFAINALLPTWR